MRSGSACGSDNGKGRWLSSPDGHQLLQDREHSEHHEHAEALEIHVGTWGHSQLYTPSSRREV